MWRGRLREQGGTPQLCAANTMNFSLSFSLSLVLSLSLFLVSIILGRRGGPVASPEGQERAALSR